MSVSTDAMNSAFHFKSAGRSQSGIAPSTDTYLGEVAADEMARGAAKAAETASADAAAAERVRPECTVALTCNRETSNVGRAELDVYGMVAVVCSHVFPCLGLALAMTAHEQHCYYERLFERLLELRPDIKYIYLDLMCRFAHKIPLIVKDLKERGALHPDVVCDPFLLLPWMHAFDHDLGCQLKYSPLYFVGAGRRVGEQTEQFWAKVKPYSKLARYMSFHHYWDGYNMLLDAITFTAQANFVATLLRRIKQNEEKLGEQGGMRGGWGRALSGRRGRRREAGTSRPTRHRRSTF